MSFGTGLSPEVSVRDYNVSKVEGALGAGRFLLGVKEFAETLVEQVIHSVGLRGDGLLEICRSDYDFSEQNPFPR